MDAINRIPLLSLSSPSHEVVPLLGGPALPTVWPTRRRFRCPFRQQLVGQMFRRWNSIHPPFDVTGVWLSGCFYGERFAGRYDGRMRR